MRKLGLILCMGMMCLGTVSCGKRGDLLPPAGYEKSPQEQSE